MCWNDVRLYVFVVHILFVIESSTMILVLVWLGNNTALLWITQRELWTNTNVTKQKSSQHANKLHPAVFSARFVIRHSAGLGSFNLGFRSKNLLG